MEAEHTPGPWEVAPDPWWAITSIQDGATVATAAPLFGRFNMEEEKSNARFIAAAPDMEKALEMYIQAEDSDPTFVEQFIWAGEAARAALAKARGETEPESNPRAVARIEHEDA